MRIEHGMLASVSSAGFVSGLFLLLVLPGLTPWTAAQTPVEDGRIRVLQNSLRAAAEQHADPKRIGKLWHSHGVQYQNGFDYENAEDAYTRAIRLLRNSALKAEYADSLHSMAVIYLMQGRLKEARSNDGQALAIFEELGQTRNAASVKGTVAMGLVREHRFQEAETEASAALAAMEAREDPDRNDLENAYLDAGPGYRRRRSLAGRA